MTCPFNTDAAWLQQFQLFKLCCNHAATQPIFKLCCKYARTVAYTAVYTALAVCSALAVYAAFAVYDALAVYVLFVFYILVNSSGHFGMASNTALQKPHLKTFQSDDCSTWDQKVTGTVILSSIILLWKNELFCGHSLLLAYTCTCRAGTSDCIAER